MCACMHVRMTVLYKRSKASEDWQYVYLKIFWDYKSLAGLQIYIYIYEQSFHRGGLKYPTAVQIARCIAYNYSYDYKALV